MVGISVSCSPLLHPVVAAISAEMKNSAIRVDDMCLFHMVVIITDKPWLVRSCLHKDRNCLAAACLTERIRDLILWHRRRSGFFLLRHVGQ